MKWIKREEVTLQRVYLEGKRDKEIKVTEEIQARMLGAYNDDSPLESQEDNTQAGWST